jgi:hypothetical protein
MSYRRSMVLPSVSRRALRVVAATSLVFLIGSTTPAATPAAQACSVAPPSAKLGFIGVATGRTKLKEDGEHTTYRWTFLIKSWTSNDSGATVVRRGMKTSFVVLEPTPNTENPSSCFDEAIVVTYTKGSTYEVVAAKFGKDWLVEAYAGKLIRVIAPPPTTKPPTKPPAKKK